MTPPTRCFYIFNNVRQYSVCFIFCFLLVTVVIKANSLVNPQLLRAFLTATTSPAQTPVQRLVLENHHPALAVVQKAACVTLAMSSLGRSVSLKILAAVFSMASTMRYSTWCNAEMCWGKGAFITESLMPVYFFHLLARKGLLHRRLQDEVQLQSSYCYMQTLRLPPNAWV